VAKRWIHWFWEGRLLYLFIALICLIIFLDSIIIGSPVKDKIRYYGLILQILGAATIIHTLKDNLFRFRRIGLFHFFLDYFKRFPLFEKRKSVNIKVNSQSYSITSGNVRVAVKPKEELKDVIRYIEEEFKCLRESIGENRSELSKEISGLEKKISNLELDMGKKITQTNKTMEAISISNIWGELFGIACVIIGLVLTTIPDELCSLLY
jgi:hypothetical protein